MTNKNEEDIINDENIKDLDDICEECKKKKIVFLIIWS